jgi:hypothetical protein
MERKEKERGGGGGGGGGMNLVCLDLCYFGALFEFLLR